MSRTYRNINYAYSVRSYKSKRLCEYRIIDGEVHEQTYDSLWRPADRYGNSGQRYTSIEDFVAFMSKMATRDGFRVYRWENTYWRFVDRRKIRHDQNVNCRMIIDPEDFFV